MTLDPNALPVAVPVSVPTTVIEMSEYRHPRFGASYQPFFELLSQTFADVLPGSPATWEDGFRRDLNPEREMAIWKDILGCYLHFTRSGDWPVARRKELFSLVLTCVSEGPKAALKRTFRSLARPEAKAVVAYVARSTHGCVRPIVVEGR